MTTGEWGTGKPAGESGSEGRGTAGAAAPTTPMGSALPLIQWASYMLTLLCISLTFVRMQVDGVLLLGTIFLAVSFWATVRMQGKRR